MKKRFEQFDRNDALILILCFFGMLGALLISGGCTPPPRPVEPLPRPSAPSYALASPGRISSLTLLPPEAPPAVTECTLEGGGKGRGGSWLSPGLESALGGELERLAGLPGAYQNAERESAKIVIKEANQSLSEMNEKLSRAEQEKYAEEVKAYQWRRMAPALFLGGAAVGGLVALFLLY